MSLSMSSEALSSGLYRPAHREVGGVWQLLFECYVVLFLGLWLSNATPFAPRALVVYVSVPLAILGVVSSARWTPSVRFLAVALLLMWGYQCTVLRQLGFKPALNVIAISLIVSHYQSRGRAGLERLTVIIAVLLAASCGLMVCTVISDSAVVFRDWLYRGVIWGSAAVANVMQTPWHRQGGLASTAFALSYQIAAGLGLFVSLAATTARSRVRWVLAIALGALALVLCGERSPLIAVATVVLGLLWLRGFKWRMAWVLLTLAVGIFALSAALSALLDAREEHLLTRLGSAELQSEVWARVELQGWAASQIPLYPFGTILHGVSYATLVEDSPVEIAAAPHNGYITRPLLFGWPLGGLTIVVLVKLGRMGKLVKGQRYRGAVPAFGGLMAVLVNACFHNASLVTFSPETLALMMLFAATFDVCRAHPSEGRARQWPRMGKYDRGLFQNETREVQ